MSRETSSKLQQLADELEYTLDKQEEIKAMLTPLEEYEEQVREKIVKGLLKEGFTYIKCSSGMGFGIVQGKKTFAIKKGSEHEALEWAKTNYPSILAINKSDLAKVLKPLLSVPEWFEEKQGDPHLSVRAAEEL